jgi:hypothetical protein
MLAALTDTAIIHACEDNKMPAEEAYRYFQLEGLNLTKIGIKVSSSDIRMINITKEG